MKSIANQYRDLKEGKISQAHFMKNVRLTFPQYVSNVTSFNDAVTILKGKSILSEALMDGETFKVVGHINGNTYSIQRPDGEVVNVDFEGQVDDVVDPPYSAVGWVEGSDGEYAYTMNADFERMGPDWEISDVDWDSLEASQMAQRDEEMYETEITINEAKKEKQVPTIDQVSYDLLTKGTEYELSKMDIISDENYLKAKQKAYKNLIKDPKAYSELLFANYKEVEKRDKTLRSQEVKKDNLVDKANAQKVIKKDTKGNTKDNLGKQEKAKKGVPEGVKQLRENILNEFGVDIPETKKKFSRGHEVVTPDGKKGHIEELSADNTAKVVHEDGTSADYQTNVLKAPGDAHPTKQEPKKEKPSIKDITEKLLKSMKEAIKKNPKTGEAVSTSTPADDALASKMGYTQTVQSTIKPLGKI